MGFKHPVARRAAASALSKSWPVTILTDEREGGDPTPRNLRYSNGETWDVGALVSAAPFVGALQFAASADLVADSAATTAATVVHKYGGTAVVFHDDDIQPKPSWLSSWQDIGYNVLRNNRPLSSFVRAYRPGETVQFLGNGGTSANSMYVPLLVTNYLSPLPVPGSGTIRLVASAGTVPEESNISIAVERILGTQGVASARVTLGANSANADLRTASVSWQHGQAGQRIVSVSASPVSQNVTVKVLVSASVLQSYDMTILNSAAVVSGETYVIDFQSPTSGVGTTADPFNSWSRLNAAAPPTAGHLIFRTHGISSGQACIPPRGTSADAAVWIIASTSTELRGDVASPWSMFYALRLVSADFVRIVGSPTAPIIIDGAVTTANRTSAATSTSGVNDLRGGWRYIMEVTNSREIEIKHLVTRDTWGWTGIEITGNSTDKVAFRSCQFGYHGIPGNAGIGADDFGDTLHVDIASGNNVLVSHCSFRAAGHNPCDATNGSLIVFRTLIDGDWSHIGGNKGARCYTLRRGSERSFVDQCIFRNVGSTDQATELGKIEGEHNVSRMCLYQNANQTVAIRSNTGSWNVECDQPRIVNNTFWDVKDGAYEQRFYSASSNVSYGRAEFVNNVMQANGSAPIIPGDVYTYQPHTPIFGRNWNENIRVRGNIFSTSCNLSFDGVGPGLQTLAFYETNHASIVSNNTQAIGVYTNPRLTTSFVWASAWGSASADFRLMSAWAGVPITSAQATTNANNVRVADSRYWRGHRGFSALPDPFFAEGQARNVTSVDYANNRLYFDSNVTLTSGANCYFYTSSDIGIPWGPIASAGY